VEVDQRGDDNNDNDDAVAARLAEAAGRHLLALRERIGAEGVDPGPLRDAGDRESQRYLAGELARWRPGDAVLSEEAADDASRLGASRVWIIDPLDGTREFGEPPRSDWAVHVALAVDGIARVGAVALPARGLLLSTASLPPRPSFPSRPPVIVVSRTRPPAEAAAVAAALGGRLAPMGSAGAKAMAVVLGEADAYIHSGGQHEWDSAAPVAVALASGLHASRLDGSPLRYNQPDPWMPDLLICRTDLVGGVLAALR